MDKLQDCRWCPRSWSCHLSVIESQLAMDETQVMSQDVTSKVSPSVKSEVAVIAVESLKRERAEEDLSVPESKWSAVSYWSEPGVSVWGREWKKMGVSLEIRQNRFRQKRAPFDFVRSSCNSILYVPFHPKQTPYNFQETHPNPCQNVFVPSYIRTPQ